MRGIIPKLPRSVLRSGPMEESDDRTLPGTTLPRPAAMPAGPDEGRPDALFAEARGALQRGDRRQSRASIESLVRALEVHFALEDRVYFPALCALQPGVEPDIRRLQREHGELREHLATIAGCLEGGTDPASLTRAFSILVTAFHDHESREEAILAAVESGLSGGGSQRPASGA